MQQLLQTIPRTAQCTGIHDSLVAAVIKQVSLNSERGAVHRVAPTDQAFTDAGIDRNALKRQGCPHRHLALPRCAETSIFYC